MNKCLIIIIFSVILQSLASIIGKKTGLSLNDESFFSFKIIIGILVVLVLLSVQAIFWMYAIKRMPLSYAYPFNALSFILIMFIAVIIFNEQMNLFNIIGSAVIVFGLIILSKSAHYD